MITANQIDEAKAKHLALMMFSRASENEVHGLALMRAAAMLAAWLASNGDNPTDDLEVVMAEHLADARQFLREMQRLCGEAPTPATERTIQ